MRGEAIRLYRQMLREVRKVESVPSREQLKRWVREEFESARHLKDEARWLQSVPLSNVTCIIILIGKLNDDHLLPSCYSSFTISSSPCITHILRDALLTCAT